VTELKKFTLDCFQLQRKSDLGFDLPLSSQDSLPAYDGALMLSVTLAH
jgi:hypothetical protein